MKFPKIHHEKVNEVIKSNGFTMEDFYLVKRKGWIRIEHISSSSYFSYFKKKETKIDPDTKAWIHNHFFRIKRSDGPDEVAPDFDSMLSQLNQWLGKLIL